MYKYEPLCKVCKSPARKIIEKKRLREKWGYDRIAQELMQGKCTEASISRHFTRHISTTATEVTKKEVVKNKKDVESFREEVGEQIALDNLIDLGLKLSFKGLQELEAEGKGLDPMVGIQFGKLRHEREKLQIQTGALEAMVMGFIAGVNKAEAIEGEVLEESE